MRIAEKAARSRLVHALSITDNPGGHPALSPNMLGLEISRLGIDPLIHFTCKDKNRNQIESILYSLERFTVACVTTPSEFQPLEMSTSLTKPWSR